MKAPIGKITEEILKNKDATKELMRSALSKGEKTFEFNGKIYKINKVSP